MTTDPQTPVEEYSKSIGVYECPDHGSFHNTWIGPAETARNDNLPDVPPEHTCPADGCDRVAKVVRSAIRVVDAD